MNRFFEAVFSLLQNRPPTMKKEKKLKIVESDAEPLEPPVKKLKRKSSSQDEAEQNPERKQRNSGVIYIQTVPPFFTVTKLRETLSKYGDVGRIFLQVTNNF